MGYIVSETVATLGALEGGARSEGVGGIAPLGARSFRDYISQLFPWILLLRSLRTGAVARAVVLFLLFLFVKAGQVAIGQDVILNAGICSDTVLIKAYGFLTFAVH